MIAVEQMKDFLLKLKREKNGSNQLRSAISFASPVDVKRYNYALIYCIVTLSMHELLGIQRDFSPPLPLSLPHPLSFSVSPLSYI